MKVDIIYDDEEGALAGMQLQSYLMKIVPNADVTVRPAKGLKNRTIKED